MGGILSIVNTLMRLQNGDPFLASIPVGKGQVYICASPLAEEGGSFTQHALFVTSLLRMAELSRPMGALYHIIGAEANIALEGVDISGEEAPHLHGPGGTDLVPEVRHNLGSTSIALHDVDLAPGGYALTLGTDTLARIALNLPRTESDPRAFTPEQLKQRLAERGLTSFSVLDASGENLAVRLTELDQGTKLWKWFVIAALIATRIIVQFVGQIGAVILLRRYRSDAERPFKMWLYPLPSVVAFIGWGLLLATSSFDILQLLIAVYVSGAIAFAMREVVAPKTPHVVT